jgi:hypothetical protein
MIKWNDTLQVGYLGDEPVADYVLTPQKVYFVTVNLGLKLPHTFRAATRDDVKVKADAYVRRFYGGDVYLDPGGSHEADMRKLVDEISDIQYDRIDRNTGLASILDLRYKRRK